MIALTTDRLLLRGWRAEDLDAWAEINADPEVRQFLGDGAPADRAGSWHMMAIAAGNEVLRGFGMWAVEERATGALIGRAGLYLPPHFPEVEVNWLLGRPWWGRGYATEAARAAIGHAFGTLSLPAVSSFIDEGNLRSIGVAERLGMHRAGAPWPKVWQYRLERRAERGAHPGG